MKELTTYNRIATYLNKIFDRLNDRYFNNELTRPTITIQSTPKAYGHFTLSDSTWIAKENGTHEINIGAGTLNRPIEEIVATLLHEMCHYYNFIKGIKDTSRGYTYHNKNFKDCAEARGLNIEHHDTYGWTITSPSDETLQFCIDNDLSDILLNRNEGYSNNTVKPIGGGSHNGAPIKPITVKPSSTRKYVCPCCGNSFRATKDINVLCMDCNTQYIKA